VQLKRLICIADNSPLCCLAKCSHRCNPTRQSRHIKRSTQRCQVIWWTRWLLDGLGGYNNIRSIISLAYILLNCLQQLVNGGQLNIIHTKHNHYSLFDFVIQCLNSLRWPDAYANAYYLDYSVIGYLCKKKTEHFTLWHNKNCKYKNCVAFLSHFH